MSPGAPKQQQLLRKLLPLHVIAPCPTAPDENGKGQQNHCSHASRDLQQLDVMHGKSGDLGQILSGSGKPKPPFSGSIIEKLKESEESHCQPWAAWEHQWTDSKNRRTNDELEVQSAKALVFLAKLVSRAI